MASRPVVAGLDGSPESRAAADWAARTAQRRGVSLRLIHAFEGRPLEGTDPSLPELRAPLSRGRQILRSGVDEIACRHPQLDVSAEQICSSPERALLTESDHAALLVLGSQGLGALAGTLVGSVAMSAVGRAVCPVVLVRAKTTEGDDHLPGDAPPPSGPYRDVVLATTCNAACDTLVEFAFREAELRRTALRVVHAWHVPYTIGLPGPEHRALVRTEAERRLGSLLRPWRERFPSVFVHEIAAEGGAAREVVRVTRGAGLLVVGRRARRHPFGSRTGSVAHALIHRVSCPIAVVPHD